MARCSCWVVLVALLPASAAMASAPVVGGSDVPDGKWGDAAAVFFGGDSTPGCTGTLVAPNVVLTAAHCIGGVSRVMVGSNVLAGGEYIDVAREVAHPRSLGDYDIGVLVLASDATVDPRVIASGCVRDNYIADGAEVAIVGWGAIRTDGGGEPAVLQEAFTTVTDHDCTNIQLGCESSISPGGEIGAGGGGIDSCLGDSGGPLYLLTERGDFLVGVTSRGFYTGSEPCGQGGIYVRPDAVVAWIEQTAGVDLPEPVCNLAPEPTATATSIVVTAGESETTTVSPNDPDVADAHTFELDTAPEHGEVAVDATGIVTYTADVDYEGLDSFVVAVRDDGSPSLTGTVLVQVEVLAAPGGCGCRAGAAAAGWPLALLVGLALIRRRRQ